MEFCFTLWCPERQKLKELIESSRIPAPFDFNFKTDLPPKQIFIQQFQLKRYTEKWIRKA